MKFSSNLLVVISLASAAAWAQTGVPATRVIPAQTMPAQNAEPAGGASAGSDDQSSNAGSQSSGASAEGASGLSGVEGQLITPEIANAKVPIPSPVSAKPQTENGVTYICGGVGDAEAQFMKQAAKDYDLKLTFASRSGAYVSDPIVTIADAKGNEVLRKTCGGPMMLVDLPKGGSYRVKAEVAGHTLDRTVKVREGRINTAVFTWPSDVVGTDKQAEMRRGPSTPSTGGSVSSGATGRGVSDENAPAERSDSQDQQEAD